MKACRFVVAATTCLVLLGSAASASADTAVRRIDHVLVEASDPQALCNLFTSTQGFALPAEWPYTDYGSFRSCGVDVGDLAVEFGNFDSSYFVGSGTQIQPPPAGSARFLGLALDDNSLQETENALQASGIGYQSVPYGFATFPQPCNTLSFTNVYPYGLSNPRIGPNSIWLQISDYSDPCLEALDPAWTNVDAAHATVNQLLANENGGPLGVTAASSVSVESPGKADLVGLGQLFAPVTANSDGSFKFSSGPFVHVVDGPTEGISKVVIDVANIDQARSYVESLGMLGSDNGNSITIARRAVQGLTFELKQTGT